MLPHRRYGYERALTRTAEPHAAQDRRQSQRGSTRATPPRLVADQWPEAEPEE
jgi:hypothetical protein